MTKKKFESGNLGRSLVKRHDRRLGPASSRHTTDTDNSGPTAISITENTAIEEFLTNAEAAQKSFEAERGLVDLVADQNNDEEKIDDQEGERNSKYDFFSIPRKPDWRLFRDKPEEFQRSEQLEFLNWKRHLAKLQETNPKLPPFEKNIEYWRQLWRIVELSDVVIQVVDARNPLFFYSTDLVTYVKEIGEWKESVMLVNKADFLTEDQRKLWAKYFAETNLRALFFSAAEDAATIGNLQEVQVEDFNTPEISNPSGVLKVIQNRCSSSYSSSLTVGFVGYPNVGKSSTINRFLTNKKLKVSATPGKTKHYQTHVIGDTDVEITMVDGPGLVIPELSMTKADMVLSGVLPIDNLTDFKPPIDELMIKIPLRASLRHYGIMKTRIREVKKQYGRSNDEGSILCSAFGTMRGFMKPGGLPDQARAARIILKDFVQGRLLYCQPPPNINPETYQQFSPIEIGIIAEDDEDDLTLEQSFPELKIIGGIHKRGVHGIKNGNEIPDAERNRKAFLDMKKLGKKDKARRMYKETL